jgi:hypothetical protein
MEFFPRPGRDGFGEMGASVGDFITLTLQSYSITLENKVS